MALGSEFQRVGAVMEMAMSPQDLCSVQMGVGWGRRLALAERSVRVGVCRWRNSGWGLVTGGFVCDEEDFEMNSLGDVVKSE